MKLNRSEIMKNAWVIYRATGSTFSISLKESWRLAKMTQNGTFEIIEQIEHILSAVHPSLYRFDRLGFLRPENKIVSVISAGNSERNTQRLERGLSTGRITKDSVISAAKYIVAGINAPRNWHWKSNIQGAEKLILVNSTKPAKEERYS